jgi:hypothetical protein
MLQIILCPSRTNYRPDKATHGPASFTPQGLTPRSVIIIITNQAIWTVWGWYRLEACFLQLSRLSRSSCRHKHPSWRTWHHRRVQQVRDLEQVSLSTGLHITSSPLPSGLVVVNPPRALEKAIATTAFSPPARPHRLVSSHQHKAPARPQSRHGPSTWHCPIQFLSSPPPRLPA